MLRPRQSGIHRRRDLDQDGLQTKKLSRGEPPRGLLCGLALCVRLLCVAAVIAAR